MTMAEFSKLVPGQELSHPILGLATVLEPPTPSRQHGWRAQVITLAGPRWISPATASDWKLERARG
jgi:hypothetical protein